MTTNVRKTAQFGDLVIAAFDAAARYSTDPADVSRLASIAVIRIMQRVRKPDPGSRMNGGARRMSP